MNEITNVDRAPLLTIAIPTYQRPRFLEKLLAELLRQIDREGPAAIEVLILDDSDGVENAAVIEALRRKPAADCLRYEVNSSNLGIDENIRACILQSRGDFVWLLGEDDLPVPSALARVLEVLTDDPPDFVFVNYWYCDGEHRRRMREPVVEDHGRAAILAFDEFVAESIWAIGFIGACIVRRRTWCETRHERFRGSYYSHVGGIIDGNLGKDMCLISEPLVLNRAEDVDTFTWSSSTFDVYHSFYSVLETSRLREHPGLLDTACRCARRLFAVDRLAWLAAKRADGVYDRSVFDVYYRSRKRNAIWKLLAGLLAVAPVAPLRMLRRAHLRRRFVVAVAPGDSA